MLLWICIALAFLWMLLQMAICLGKAMAGQWISLDRVVQAVILVTLLIILKAVNNEH